LKAPGVVTIAHRRKGIDMTGRRRLQVFACLAVLACLAVACRRESSDRAAPFTGRWVTNAGGRPFLALTLERRHGQYSGTLTAPERWATSDGTTFTRVGPGTVTRSIASASLNQTVLHLVVENPKDRTDKDEFDLALVDPAHASLKLVGVPFVPWPLTKQADVSDASTAWDPELSYVIDRPTVAPNAEMTAIFDEDQAARRDWPSLTAAQRAAVGVGDARRRKRTRVLLEAGQLRAGADFRRAAFVFQHGDAADDFLVAHTLALVALATGDPEARWIAAATLDRYLTTIGKPQIYGTQFDNQLALREPYNRGLIPDDVRKALNVPTLSEQLDRSRVPGAGGKSGR